MTPKVFPDKVFDAQRHFFPQKEIEEDHTSVRKVKELSVIDGRRAQNCNILLSRSVLL